MTVAMQGAAGGRGTNTAQMQAMQTPMEQMFGGSVPTLRKVLGSHVFQSVQASTSIRDASKVMAQVRKGVLVMGGKKGKELIGILTPKDLLSRVLSKNLNPDTTQVEDVMTPNPDCVSADLTLLDALKEMHDHKYLHLPVKDNDGRVVGLVDVMDLLCHTAGGEGSTKGWRDFFKSAMAARGDRDVSDTGSDVSRSASTARSKGRSGGGRQGDKSNGGDGGGASDLERPVSKLRPKAPISFDSSTILEVASKMAASRVDLRFCWVPMAVCQASSQTMTSLGGWFQFVDPSISKVDSAMTRIPSAFIRRILHWMR